MFKRVFFFEENREVLLLQKGEESLSKYKYDYIFSDYENTLLISSSIKSTICNYIRNERNLCFFTFGEEKLGKWISNYVIKPNKIFRIFLFILIPTLFTFLINFKFRKNKISVRLYYKIKQGLILQIYNGQHYKFNE